MAKAPRCPTFLQFKGECGSEGSGMAKVLSLSLSLSPSSSSFRSWLWAQDAGEAEKAKWDESKMAR